MRIPALPLLLPIVCLLAPAQTTTIDVGSGAPTEAIRQQFIRTFFRNNFNTLVALPPLGNVKALGAQALVQEFSDTAKTANTKYAIVKNNVNAPTVAGDPDMLQFYPALYAYYTSVGPSNAGYPTSDTLTCPALASLPMNSCQYQLFDKPFALFVYKSNLPNNTVNVPLGDPYYTKWQALGGISGPGPAMAASVAITAPSGIAATVQTFDKGAVFNITSGILSGRLVGVGPGVYPTYAAAGGYTGFLGLPVADEQLLASGHKRQNFEGGSIEYDPATGAGALRYPVLSISVAPSTQTLKLNLGDTLMLTATLFDVNGNMLTDRTLAWTTSDSRVVSVQPAGLTATIKASGGGTAIIAASSEGKVSPSITVTVIAPCCSIGEGSPTPAVQQAFLDAVARNHLTLALPTALPVQRLGTGYVQAFTDPMGTVSYLLAVADRSTTAYVISGATLAAYLQLGGPAGPLGYPASDATAAGRQLFVNQAALAGNPVQVVAAPFLAKWAALGYETGAAGNPVGPSAAVLTFRATAGAVQPFVNGLLASNQNQVFYTGGLIAAAFTQAGGATGSMGLPISDEYSLSGERRQDFEGGYIGYGPSDAAAQVHSVPRQPSVTATPSTVLAGTRVRVAAGGFDPGATLRVSITGQPDFTISTETGAYAWQTVVPANAISSTVTVKAVDTVTSASATGSYQIRTSAEMALQLSKISGDGQAGLPGAVLPQPLVVLLKDSAGGPVAGAPVQFTASPGAEIVNADALTGANGQARAMLRLPASDGIAQAAAGTGKQVVTFSVQAVHGSVPNFPKLVQSPAAGPLLTSIASILQFYQNRNADPSALNAFLTANDGYLDAQAQIPNLWRLAPFAGGNLTVVVVKPDLAVIRDILGQGSPVLLALSTPGQYVVATGIAKDGSLVTMDPNPAGSSGVPVAAVRLVPQAPATPGFLVSGTTSFTIGSPTSSCGNTLQLGPYTQQFCSGTESAYQLDTSSDGPFQLTLTPLGNPANRVNISGSGPSSFGINGSADQWTAAPQALTFTAAGVVNAASFTPALAPGGIFTVFGAGLSRAGTDTSADLNGTPAQIIAQSPFQVSGILPLDLQPGSYILTLTSGFGTASQPVSVSPVAPAIFAGAVVNQDGVVNTPQTPAQRGKVVVIYCTGLGAVVRQGQLSAAATPVTASLAGVTLKPSFAGLTPGFPGLYQVNVPIPANTPPGISLPLTIQQAGATSNQVELSLE